MSVAAQRPALLSSARQDWRTPRGLFAQLHAEFGFTLDACASDGNALLARYYTEADESLLRSWEGERVYCNPPYNELRRWLGKMYAEAGHAEVVVALIPARTDTAAWHDYVMRADEIRFLRGRLSFDDSGGTAPFPSCVVVWRGRPAPPQRETLFYPEPPRDSGEADAVNGLTALGTQHDIGTKGEPAR